VSPAALASLTAMTHDAAVPASAKFETLAYLDRLLGLDLARDIAKPTR